MTDNTPTETDENTSTDADNGRTITVPFEVDLDDIHAPAWDVILATAPGRDQALAEIAEQCQFALDPQSAIYQRYRTIEEQRGEIDALQELRDGD